MVNYGWVQHLNGFDYYFSLKVSIPFYNLFLLIFSTIVHFTVVCLVAKPLYRSEAKGDLVMLQTLLLLKCKLICYHAN